MATAPARWFVGHADSALRPGDGVVALDVADASAAAGHRVEWFHDVMDRAVEPAGAVSVRVPEFRGKSLVALLAWLVSSRLAAPGAEVEWRLGRRQGPDSVRRLLAELGWVLDRERDGATFRLRGAAPPPGEQPSPRTFADRVAGVDLVLAADWGVFSPDHVDDGTRLLVEVAERLPPVDLVADVGIGYGPIAVAMVKAGLARRAVGTDVDSVALWLATRNAAEHGVPLAVLCTPDPGDADPAPLTVCNVPTHIDAAATAALMAALLSRAQGARLLTVVHASLEQRYARYVDAAGAHWTRHAGPSHVVFDVRG